MPMRCASARKHPGENGKAPRIDKGVWTGIVGWRHLPRGLVMDLATGARGAIATSSVIERPGLEYARVIHAGKAKWESILIGRLRRRRWP